MAYRVPDAFRTQETQPNATSCTLRTAHTCGKCSTHACCARKGFVATLCFATNGSVLRDQCWKTVVQPRVCPASNQFKPICVRCFFSRLHTSAGLHSIIATNMSCPFGNGNSSQLVHYLTLNKTSVIKEIQNPAVGSAK